MRAVEARKLMPSFSQKENKREQILSRIKEAAKLDRSAILIDPPLCGLDKNYLSSLGYKIENSLMHIRISW